MFKKRFLLVLGVLSILLVTMAVSRPFSNAPSSANLSWPPRPVIIPMSAANNLSDYHERHSDLNSTSYQKYPGQWVSRSAGVAIPVTSISAASDYFQRHAELIAPAGAGIAVDMSDYFMRHSELAAPAESNDLSDYYLRH